MARKRTGRQDLPELHDRLKRLDEVFQHLWRSYYSRETPKHQRPTYEAVRAAAQEFVTANHEYQMARYGRVMVRLSVSKLMR
jgi:hypothetical protein